MAAAAAAAAVLAEVAARVAAVGGVLAATAAMAAVQRGSPFRAGSSGRSHSWAARLAAVAAILPAGLSCTAAQHMVALAACDSTLVTPYGITSVALCIHTNLQTPPGCAAAVSNALGFDGNTPGLVVAWYSGVWWGGEWRGGAQ